jgi:hypothetical protein
MKGAPLGAMESLGAGSVLVLCEYLYTSADHRSALMFALRIAAAQGFAVGNDTRENGKQLVRTRTVSTVKSLLSLYSSAAAASRLGWVSLDSTFSVVPPILVILSYHPVRSPTSPSPAL